MIVEFSDKTKILMQLHCRLSEKDRRHYAALEFLKLGRGGDYISTVLAVDWGHYLSGKKS